MTASIGPASTLMEICWAAQRAGLYYTAISRYLTEEEIAYIVRDCGAKVFITSPSCADKVKGIIKGEPGEPLFFMGFAEALSDDGSLTGRGSPWLRGAASGIMTALGGLGHTMPFLVPDSWPNAFWIATVIACVVVFFELWAIAFIRSRYMDTPFLQAVFQIVLGGAIVLGVGILIGAA